MVDSMSSDDNENEFNENLDNIINILNLNNCYKLWKFKNIKCSAGSNSGDNYMSVVKRITLFGKDCKNKDEKLLLIIKRQIPSRSRRQLYRCDEAFTNEINAYKYIVPLLEQSSTESILLPKCYFAGQDEYGDIIILEDLKPLNFEMKNRLIGLDFEHCQLVMKKLAAMHAASIAIKELDYTNFQKYRQHIKEIVYCDEARDFYKNLLDSSITNSLCSLRKSNTDGCLNEPIKLIERLQTKLFDKIENYVTSSKDKYNVFCHGDLWINNIMFKYNTSDNYPNDVKFFDLQTMRYTSPVFDILHFIYTSTKRDLRDNHLKHILQIYSNALMDNINCNFLSNNYYQQNYKNNTNNLLERIKEIYSLENITNQFYSHILYGLAVCMWILPAVTFDPNNIPNLNIISNDVETNVKELNVEQNLTNEYHSRMKDIVLEFYQNGFLHV